MPDLIPTIIPSVESVTSDLAPKMEKEEINEIIPSSTPNPKPQQETTNKTSASTPKIVNKTEEPEILHPVDPKADTLTTIASEEEQDFIKEVMKEHQDGSK